MKTKQNPIITFLQTLCIFLQLVCISVLELFKYIIVQVSKEYRKKNILIEYQTEKRYRNKIKLSDVPFERDILKRI